MIDKIEQLRSIGANSLMLHYPPWYGSDRAIASLEMFAARSCRNSPAPRATAAASRKAPAHAARV